eukprot:scaffold80826_cov61-Attheya_sp.AAC.3
MKLKHILARQLATITLRGKFCLYSQWLFPGCEKDVANSCSRDFDIPDKRTLTHLRTQFPEQLPDDLVLKVVPPQIDSWLWHVCVRNPAVETTNLMVCLIGANKATDPKHKLA